MKLPDSFSWVDVSDETFSNTLNDLLETDKNLNIIGPAGTGKSLLIKIASICLNKQVAICSTTGISAVNLTSDNIKATTLHSFFHLKPITVFNDEMIQVDHTLYNIMKRIDVLIIDEVSMLSSHMFDVIFKLLVMYRGAISKLPRIILFSDILQLPPVVNKQDPIINNFFEEEYDGNIMFFNSRFFQSMEFKTIHLTKLFRQKDSLFQNILNRIRLSEQTEEDLKIINEYVMPIEKYNSKNELYMYIATTNKVVENINENYFTFFKGEPRIYEGRKFGDFDMTKILPQDRIVKIKPNMQIMCTKNNYDDNYRNGSLGKVISCDPVSVKVILKNG
jgi:ATP-dependent exoDNAse (exonuclease V) alpha subunit